MTTEKRTIEVTVTEQDLELAIGLTKTRGASSICGTCVMAVAAQRASGNIEAGVAGYAFYDKVEELNSTTLHITDESKYGRVDQCQMHFDMGEYDTVRAMLPFTVTYEEVED